jgi:hypothetical protein
MKHNYATVDKPHTMPIVVLLLLATLMLQALPVAAQESIFGLQFLGTSEETSDARARAMGVLGIGLDERRSAITQNPATLALLDHMTISAMFVTGSRNTRSATDDENFAVARFPHARFALPMFGKFVVSAGFSGFRNFKGKINLPEQEIDGLKYRNNFVRDGTIFMFPLGVSFSLTKRLHVGASMDFVLGTVDESWETRSDSLVSLATRRRSELNARTFTVGALWQPWSWVSLGASWNPQFYGDGSTRWTLEDVRIIQSTTPIRDESRQGNVLFPQAWKVGASLKLHRKLLLTSDALWREWTVYDGSLFEAEAVGNEWRLGAGMELQRDSRIDFRWGFSHQKWPQIVGGNELKETTFHLGTGFDISDVKSRIDLAVEYALIGDIDKNLFEERTIRFVISISGQEEWKRRRPNVED